MPVTALRISLQSGPWGYFRQRAYIGCLGSGGINCLSYTKWQTFVYMPADLRTYVKYGLAMRQSWGGLGVIFSPVLSRARLFQIRSDHVQTRNCGGRPGRHPDLGAGGASRQRKFRAAAPARLDERAQGPARRVRAEDADVVRVR